MGCTPYRVVSRYNYPFSHATGGGHQPNPPTTSETTTTTTTTNKQTNKLLTGTEDSLLTIGSLQRQCQQTLPNEDTALA